MGFFTNILRSLGLLKRPASVIVVGLDNAGKSMIINSLKPARSASFEVTPTVGFAMDQFEKGGISFKVWDMSGAGAYRSLWETYYTGIDAIIFVVDSSDQLRMCVARDELEALLAHAHIVRDKPPMLFYANKMDLPGALVPAETGMQLGLTAMNDRPWQISASNALTGEGVSEGVLETMILAVGDAVSDGVGDGVAGGVTDVVDDAIRESVAVGLALAAKRA